MSSFGVANIRINDGFWKKRQEINRNITMKCVKERFESRFNALKCDWKPGMENEPHIYWDSDVAKWLEAAAYVILKTGDKSLEKTVDECVDLIKKNRDKNGYFNSYYLTHPEEKRFSVRINHELYCAGHFIEAAVAYAEVTGKEKFLKLMEEYVDYIYKVFVEDKSAAFITPGHEEIELALVRLYRYTKNNKHLELSKFFVDNRGKTVEQPNDEYNLCETQDHLPVREQRTAEGHSVRACYLYSAMADLALELKDEELYTACKAILDDIVTKKMYITGGVGSSRLGEAFTVPYDLPNLTAYQETCASISLCMFANRMDKLEIKGLYGDLVERIIYNGFSSGISLDGDSFFYENPLEIRPQLIEKDVSVKKKTVFPITQRVKLFNCSCCPPNICRFTELLEDYISDFNNDTLYIKQYIACDGKTENLGFKIISDYPNNGKIIISTKGVKRLALRIPAWCKKYIIEIKDKKASHTIKDGYAYLELDTDETEIKLYLDMPVQTLEANPRVLENVGKIAVMRGPIVYCAEGVDNDCILSDIRLMPNSVFSMEFSELFNAHILSVSGYLCKPDKSSALYFEADAEYLEKKIKMIPYYGFANRGVSEMQVWFLKK